MIEELPRLTGTSVSGSNPLRSWPTTLDDVQWATVAVGVVALAVVFGLGVIAPRIAGALVE